MNAARLDIHWEEDAWGGAAVPLTFDMNAERKKAKDKFGAFGQRLPDGDVFQDPPGRLGRRKPGYYLILLRTEVRNAALRRKAPAEAVR